MTSARRSKPTRRQAPGAKPKRFKPARFAPPKRELGELEATRRPLLRQTEELRRRLPQGRCEPEHLCCTRRYNQMRISPLEAQAIRQAFFRDSALRAKLPGVLARLEKELASLQDTEERQRFDCPLLEGTRCLVHTAAKPIGCLAWNSGREFSRVAWTAFKTRDALNDGLYGRGWKLRVIPLWLKRVFARELRRG